MKKKLSRRAILRGSVTLAGAVALGGPLRLLGGIRASSRRASLPTLPVAIQRCESYDRKLVAERFDRLFDLIGGIKSLVRGKTVTVKLNLTGSPKRNLGGLPSYRTYHVHPVVVAALCHRLRREGARRIVLVESYYIDQKPEEILSGAGWDIAMIKSAGDHEVSFEDTRNRGSWKGYSRFKVPWGGYLFPALDLNQRYEKTDVFISLAKLKDHANAGVTLAVKNLFGIVPTSLYGGDAPNENSLGNRGKILHNGERSVPSGVPAELDPNSTRHWSYRVPRVTADIYGARPVDLAIVEGVETNRGGEGPWIKGVEPLKARVMVAGKNAVCTDAVCCAVMGYSPEVDHREFPFPGQNHLKLLSEAGVGEIDTSRIEVLGDPVKDVLHPFNPDRKTVGNPLKF